MIDCLMSVAKRRHLGSRKSPLTAALGIAGASLAGGFGVMNLFWLLGHHDPKLPGLYDYLTSSVGDAVLLPSLLGGLSYANRSLPATRGSSKAFFGGLAAGGLIGMATQISWLTDNQPGLNWTLPVPHKFNAAGVYHGLFLTAAVALTSGLTLSLAAKIVVHIKSGLQLDRNVRFPTGLALVSAVVFSILLWFDNQGTIDRSASRATMIALMAGYAFFLVVVVVIRILTSRQPKRKP